MIHYSEFQLSGFTDVPDLQSHLNCVQQCNCYSLIHQASGLKVCRSLHLQRWKLCACLCVGVSVCTPHGIIIKGGVNNLPTGPAHPHPPFLNTSSKFPTPPNSFRQLLPIPPPSSTHLANSKPPLNFFWWLLPMPSTPKNLAFLIELGGGVEVQGEDPPYQNERRHAKGRRPGENRPFCLLTWSVFPFLS